MKKRFFSLFLCAALLLSIVFSAHTARAASSYSSPYTYTDVDTGATFVVPEGWSEQKLDAETSKPFQAQFSFQKDPGSAFLYGSSDLWSGMTASERSGYTRSDIDSAYVYAYDDGALIDYLAENLIQGAAESGGEIKVDEIGLVTYGKNESIEIWVSQEIFGVRVPSTVIVHVENGYILAFVFAGNSEQAVKDFHSVLYSLRVPAAEESALDEDDSERSVGSDWTDRLISHSYMFFGELFLSFFIYVMPLLAFQTLFRKKPMCKNRAFFLLLIYSVAAYIVVSCATILLFDRMGNLLILLWWDWITYHGLAGGNESDDTPAKTGGRVAAHNFGRAEMPSTAKPVYTEITPASPTSHAPASAALQTPPSPTVHIPVSPAPSAPHAPVSPTPQTPPPAPRILFCKNCGFRLLEDSKFCSSCGALVDPAAKG